MQAIYKNEDEEGSYGRTDPIGAILCIGGIRRCLKEEHIGGFGSRDIGI